MSIESLHIYPLKSARAVDVSELVIGESGIVGDRLWGLIDHEDKRITQREEPRLAAVAALGGLRNSLYCSHPDMKNDLEIASSFQLVQARASVTMNMHSDQIKVYEYHDIGWFSELLERPDARLVRLVDGVQRHMAAGKEYGRHQDETLAGLSDVAQMHIVNKNTVAAYSEYIGQEVPVDRFRPNVVIDVPAFSEYQALGTMAVLGNVEVLMASDPAGRCTTTNVDQLNGERAQPKISPKLGAFHREHGYFTDTKDLQMGVYASHVRTAPQVIRVGDEVTL